MKDTPVEAKPTVEAEGSTKSDLTNVGKRAMQGPEDDRTDNNTPKGEFEFTDWSGYPERPKPEGPFRLLPEEEYITARQQANACNVELHRSDPSLKGLQIHEVQPVKFGGSPTDLENKIALTPEQHMEYTKWWKHKQAEIEAQQGGKA